MSKTFAEGNVVEVVRDTEHGRSWEEAVYVKTVNDMPGWHWVRLKLGGDKILVPARRIRTA